MALLILLNGGQEKRPHGYTFLWFYVAIKKYCRTALFVASSSITFRQVKQKKIQEIEKSLKQNWMNLNVYMPFTIKKCHKEKKLWQQCALYKNIIMLLIKSGFKTRWIHLNFLLKGDYMTFFWMLKFFVNGSLNKLLSIKQQTGMTDTTEWRAGKELAWI